MVDMCERFGGQLIEFRSFGRNESTLVRWSTLRVWQSNEDHQRCSFIPFEETPSRSSQSLFHAGNSSADCDHPTPSAPTPARKLSSPASTPLINFSFSKKLEMASNY